MLGIHKTYILIYISTIMRNDKQTKEQKNKYTKTERYKKNKKHYNNMKKQNKTTLTERVAYRMMMESKGLETYKPITLLKKVFAYSLIGLGVGSLPLPTGSIWFIMGGCTLLGVDYKVLLNTIKQYYKSVYSWVGLAIWKGKVWYKVRGCVYGR